MLGEGSLYAHVLQAKLKCTCVVKGNQITIKPEEEGNLEATKTEVSSQLVCIATYLVYCKFEIAASVSFFVVTKTESS